MSAGVAPVRVPAEETLVVPDGPLRLPDDALPDDASSAAAPRVGCVLVVGATSAIARHVAAAYARRGYALFLAGRDIDETARVAADLHVRYGVATYSGAYDAGGADASDHDAPAERLFEAVDAAVGDQLAGVVVAVGMLGDHTRALTDARHARAIMHVNYVAVADLLAHAANRFDLRDRGGFLVAISSVAGDRGRQSNYVYGSAKGALSLYVQGLRNRMWHRGVRVHTVKPGFVDTAMTFGLPNVPFAADPADVGERIVRGVERGREVIYVPGLWRWIMLAIRLVPERLFKRLRL